MKKVEKKKIKTVLRKIRKKIAEDHESEYLEGVCAIAAFIVFKTLRKMKYKPVYCYNHNHCFTTLDGYIIDLTARQFDKHEPKVVFRKKSKARYHEVTKQSSSDKEIKKFLRGWCTEQSPFQQKRYIKSVLNYAKSVI